ncbi:putative immunity protein [Methanolapillus millepedarum]|uniref:Imm-5-like domain-containing protein n=1 Tax=Methanolapillus millepedarum TaxID=3028296 RepID=A0AA96ZTM1_9EURY|nr:hypothetical protein MsAc7_02800 [Methanosarcinaceae archaeon Ac7]
MKKLLFSRESECIQPIRELVEKQNHRTLILWALDCTTRILPIFEEKHPTDQRPQKTVENARLWARGDIIRRLLFPKFRREQQKNGVQFKPSDPHIGNQDEA